MYLHLPSSKETFAGTKRPRPLGVSEKDTTGTGKPFNITGLPETGQCHRHTVHTVQAGLGVYPGKGSRDGIFITRREESWHSYNVYYNVILKT